MKFKKFVSIVLVTVLLCTTFMSSTISLSSVSAAEVEAMEIGGAVSGDYQYQVLDDNTAEIIKYTGFAMDLTLPSKLDGYSVTSIGNWAFLECTTLKSIIIPQSVTNINYGAFYRCERLTDVLIPNSVTSIGSYAFGSCTSITSVTIPDSVTIIGNCAFYDCTSLANIDVDNNNQNYSSLNGNLYDKSQSTLIQYAIGKKDTSFTIPNSVTSVGNFAFYGCTSLTGVTIGAVVTSIGDYAFGQCTGLTDVYYTGTEGEWYSITILGHNDSLTSANIHYNYVEIKSQTISLSKTSYTKTYGDKPFNLNASAKTSLQYKSSNTKVATVSSNGTVTIKDSGSATITITANGTDQYKPTVKTVKITVKKATQKITAKSYTKTYGSKAFSLGAKSSGNGKLTYSSGDKKVATVSSKGVVTVKGCGKATITIKASATSKYKSASKKITVTVKPAKLKITGYKGSKLIFTPQANVSGYEVKIAKVGSKFKKNLKLSSKSKYLDLKKYSKGDYKIQIRAYKKVSKSTYYGAWGKCQLTLR